MCLDAKEVLISSTLLVPRAPAQSSTSSQAGWSNPWSFWSKSFGTYYLCKVISLSHLYSDTSDFPHGWPAASTSESDLPASFATSTKNTTPSSSIPASLTLAGATATSITQPIPSISGTPTSRSGTNIDAVVGGATAAGVAALLFLTGILLYLLRRRRRSLDTHTDSHLVHAINQYTLPAPNRHVDSKRPLSDRREGRRSQETHHDMPEMPQVYNTTVGRPVANDQNLPSSATRTPILDSTAASVMFRQLEGLMRSLNLGRQHAEISSADTRSEESLPRYDSIA